MFSLASGEYSTASGNFSLALNFESNATGLYSMASGPWSSASAQSSIAMGPDGNCLRDRRFNGDGFSVHCLWSRFNSDGFWVHCLWIQFYSDGRFFNCLWTQFYSDGGFLDRQRYLFYGDRAIIAPRVEDMQRRWDIQPVPPPISRSLSDRIMWEEAVHGIGCQRILYLKLAMAARLGVEVTRTPPLAAITLLHIQQEII